MAHSIILYDWNIYKKAVAELIGYQMNKFEIELFFDGIYATEIEDEHGNFFSNFDEDFGSIKLTGTEALSNEALVKYVSENLKIIFDGTLDNAEHFKSYAVRNFDGPSGAHYTESGLSLGSLSLFLEVETTHDNTDEIDFDDFFHIVVFQLVRSKMTISFTEFEGYHSNISSN